MASSHGILAKLVARNAAVQSEVLKLFSFVVQRALPNRAATTASVSGAASTTPAAVSALTVTDGVGYNGGFPVIGGRTYAFNAYLPCTVDGTTAGVKILANGGSCTFASFSGVGTAIAASSLANLASTSKSTPTLVSSVAAYTLIRLSGTFTAATSGTFGLSIGQSASGGTAPAFTAGSYVEITEIPQA